MIFDISDEQFLDIMQNKSFHLPMRWDGRDFEDTLSLLLDKYVSDLSSLRETDSDEDLYEYINVDLFEISAITQLLKQCVRQYHNGFPADAFLSMRKIMRILMKTPLKVYQKSSNVKVIEDDKLYLYRLRGVNDSAKHTRKDLFHVPSCLRSMISTCRYSISGYPALYLTTSIKLGQEEINTDENRLLVSRFKIIRPQKELNIQVLELGIKPQDFVARGNDLNSIYRNRKLNEVDLQSGHVRAAYLKWYPLIAACSFIRANKNTPFSSEYIIPQLLMQWVRKQVGSNKLMGIRYFSCASIRASELGFDYVFPVDNTEYAEGYCSVLRDSFWVTLPVYLREFDSPEHCEQYLVSSTDLDKI